MHRVARVFTLSAKESYEFCTHEDAPNARLGQHRGELDSYDSLDVEKDRLGL